MPNFERDEWLFSTEIGMSGYKQYFNQRDLTDDCLLMQANIAEVLNFRPEFTESDHSMLLKYQIRVLMNMVPFTLDSFMQNEINWSNFLQPMELLNAQSFLDIMVHDPAYLQKALNEVPKTTRVQYSLFEDYIKILTEEDRKALFTEDYYIPSMFEVSRDSVCMNPLLRCFEADPIYYGSLERIMAYMFSRPYSKN